MKITLLAVAIYLFTGINAQVPSINAPQSSAQNVSFLWSNNGACSGSIALYEVQYEAQGQTTPPPMMIMPQIAGVITVTQSAVSPSEGTASKTIRGLTPCTNYIVQLRANCTDGSSSNFSATVVFETASEAPLAPLNLTKTATTSTQIDVAWDSPSVCTAFITGYAVYQNGTKTLTNSTMPSFSFPGLDPNTEYMFRVAALISDQEGALSDILIARTTEAPPSAPLDFRGEALTSTSVRVAWDPPASANGVLVGYTVRYGVTTGALTEELSVSVPSLQADIVGLMAMAPYFFSVFARNTANGTESTEISIITPVMNPTTPSAPEQLRATETGATHLNLCWNPPLRDGTLDYYTVECNPGTFSFNTTGTCFNVTGLQPETQYNCSVTPFTTGGMAGTPSDMSTSTTISPTPNGVTNIMVSADSTGMEANITWTAPTMGTATMYSIVISDANGIVTSESTNSPMYMATGLSPYILYTVTVTAATSGGNGPPTSHMFYTLQDLPTVTVRNVQGSGNSDGLTVSFDPITNPAEGRGNLTYTVCYMLRGSTDQVCQVTDTSPATFSGNFAGSIYTVTVTPMTAAGQGMPSTQIEVDTRNIPIRPHNLALIVTLAVVVPIVAVVVAVSLIVLFCLLAKAKS